MARHSHRYSSSRRKIYSRFEKNYVLNMRFEHTQFERDFRFPSNGLKHVRIFYRTTTAVNKIIKSFNKFLKFLLSTNIRRSGVLQIQLFESQIISIAASMCKRTDTIKTRSRMIGSTFSIRVVDDIGGIIYTALSIFHSISVSKSVQCIYNLGNIYISAFRRRSRTY